LGHWKEPELVEVCFYDECFPCFSKLVSSCRSIGPRSLGPHSAANPQAACSPAPPHPLDDAQILCLEDSVAWMGIPLCMLFRSFSLMIYVSVLFPSFFLSRVASSWGLLFGIRIWLTTIWLHSDLIIQNSFSWSPEKTYIQILFFMYFIITSKILI
jgi:hypothetical protein